MTATIRAALGVLFTQDSYDLWSEDDTYRILLHLIDVDTVRFETDETWSTRGIARVTPEGVQVVFTDDDEDLCQSALVTGKSVAYDNLDAEALRAYRRI